MTREEYRTGVMDRKVVVNMDMDMEVLLMYVEKDLDQVVVMVYW